MSNSKKLTLQQLSSINPQFYCLLAALGIEFLLMALGGYGLYVLDNYAIMPCMLFLGTVLVCKISPDALRKLGLGIVVAVWFCLTQAIHFAQDLQVRNAGLPFSVYLMAFPFAAITRDGKNQYGLRLAGAVYLAAALTLTGLTGLLFADALPGFLVPHVYWDGARLQAMWHPNICASIMMTGIAFALGFSTLVKKAWGRGLLLACAALLFCVMALTNSRTSILMAAALIAGFTFFAIIRKGGWKRFVIGFAIALILIPSLFTGAKKLFDANQARLIARYTAQIQTDLTPSLSSSSEPQSPIAEESTPDIIVGADGQAALKSKAAQYSFSIDMRTLNGRTVIWKAAIQAVRDNPAVLLWGVDHSGNLLTDKVSFAPAHVHNSWFEILLCLGLPGLLSALFFTGMALWYIAVTLLGRNTSLWQKTIALLMLCLLGAGFLEPYLFLSDRYYHYADFLFFLLLGYLSQKEAVTTQ